MTYAVVLAAPSVTADFAVQKRVLAEAGIGLFVARDEPRADDLLAEADLVLAFGYVIDAPMIARLRHCRGIVSFSTGLDHIDTAAARAAGIPVRNVPDYAMQEVAEHAFALLFALARKVVALDRAARGGDWSWRPVAGEVHTIAGRTLGVVGLGRIGRRVADMGHAFGLNVCAHDPFVSETAEYPLLPLETVLVQSDFVSLHVPLSAATRHLIGAHELGLMPRRAFLINTARGGLIDERALLEALRAGRLAGAALDVREQEPPPLPDPMAELPNVILTPHVGAYSLEAGERLHDYGSRIAVELCAPRAD